MTDEPIDDRPWGEEQWERLLRESEARSARYGELLETLFDHPDRDAIISREMGWGGDDGFAADDEEDQIAEELSAINDPPSEEEIAEIRRQHDDLEKMPAYSRSFAWSIGVFDVLKEEVGQLEGDLEELVGETIGDAGMVAAKIAGGHGIGYEDEALCGNIVCCKRSLEAARRSLSGLCELSDRHPPLRDRIAPLLEEGHEVERLVEHHIAELRARVWWE